MARLTAFDPLAPDAVLLDRFRRERDGAAFALLVRRHGPLVLGVCRRVTGDPHLADDAFQAAWLVLARKPEAAADLRGFLYGVAVRVSRKARSRHLRRRRWERLIGHPPERGVEPHTPDADELRRLTEAVGHLPDHLRAAVVLCELDGLSRADAAKRLAVPEGTLSSRLAKARKLLGWRLSAAAGGGVAVPPALQAAAVAAARGGTPMRLATWSWALAAVGLVTAGGVAAWPVPRDEPKPVAAKPKPADPGKLLVWDSGRHVLLDPDGKVLAERTYKHPDGWRLDHPQVSPDGGQVAFVSETRVDKPGPDYTLLGHVMVFPAEGGAGRRLEARPANLFWLPNGDLCAAEVPQPRELTAKEGRVTSVRLNPVTGNRVPLDLPRWFIPSAVLPDGRTFVGVRLEFDKQKAFLCRVAPGGVPDDLCELPGAVGVRLAPGGRRLLFATPAAADPERVQLELFDVTTRSHTKLPGLPADAVVQDYCWSPDGKRLAYTWKKVPPGAPRIVTADTEKDPRLNAPTESFLTVADADGGNARNIRSARGDTTAAVTLGDLDWR